jgi:hypothetical protein
MTMLPQQIFAGINSFPVMAIPLFIQQIEEVDPRVEGRYCRSIRRGRYF